MTFNLALPPTSLRARAAQSGPQTQSTNTGGANANGEASGAEAAGQGNGANGISGMASVGASAVQGVLGNVGAQSRTSRSPVPGTPAKRSVPESATSQQAAEALSQVLTRLEQVTRTLQDQPANAESMREMKELAERIQQIRAVHGIVKPPEAKMLRTATPTSAGSAATDAPIRIGTDGQVSQPNPPSVPVPSGALTSKKLAELVREVDPKAALEPEVENILLEIADEFIDSVTHFSCKLAGHRKSKTLTAGDVALFLERNYHIRIPGFPDRDGPNNTSIHSKRLSQGFYAHLHNRPATVSQHSQRVQLVKKAMLEESYRKEKEAKRKESEEEMQNARRERETAGADANEIEEQLKAE